MVIDSYDLPLTLGKPENLNKREVIHIEYNDIKVEDNNNISHELTSFETNMSHLNKGKESTHTHNNRHDKEEEGYK